MITEGGGGGCRLVPYIPFIILKIFAGNKWYFGEQVSSR